MRHRLTFDCAGATLAASVDLADGRTGLLIVSGGNEILAGAHRGMASLAADIAASGYPVFRFDRRGIGDSGGKNGGYRSSGPDIAAAINAFRTACPALTQIVAFGNCDAASALVLHQSSVGADQLILANPWLLDDDDGDSGADAGHDADQATAAALPPASAIRARYIAKLKNPREWVRLLSGGVNLRKLARGLSAARADPQPNDAATALAVAMNSVSQPVTILIAQRDRTAQAFIEQWLRPEFADSRARIPVHHVNSASHSFADAMARRWLIDHITAVLQSADQAHADTLRR